MKRIGILTSGGDAPGMNAAIRATVRTAKYLGMETIGIKRGYEGLLDDDMQELEICDVGDIIHRGGTILKSARSARFRTPEGVAAAAKILRRNRIDGLLVCGGDGTYRGAAELEKHGIGVAGIPGTIDNDMGYTDFTIGFDTAVSTVLDAVSKIRDTSSSHNRVSIIEVMGRDCGDIALHAGLAGGADAILIPELPVDMETICGKLRRGFARGKLHSIVMKAEGVDIPNAEIEETIQNATGHDARTAVLGYIQRGGTPTRQDRILAAQTANRAVELMRMDRSGFAVGINQGAITEIPLAEAAKTKREADLQLIALIDMLSI